MAQSGKDKRIADLFKKDSHHKNFSVTYIVQNMFHYRKEMRNFSLKPTISSCSSYLGIDKFPHLQDQSIPVGYKIL